MTRAAAIILATLEGRGALSGLDEGAFSRRPSKLALLQRFARGYRHASWVSPEGDRHELPDGDEMRNGLHASEYNHPQWAEDASNHHLIPEDLKVRKADGSISGEETKNRMLGAGWIKIHQARPGAIKVQALDHPAMLDQIKRALTVHHPDALARTGGFTWDRVDQDGYRTDKVQVAMGALARQLDPTSMAFHHRARKDPEFGAKVAGYASDPPEIQPRLSRRRA